MAPTENVQITGQSADRLARMRAMFETPVVWPAVRNFPALTLRQLAALSVGLSPLYVAQVNDWNALDPSMTAEELNEFLADGLMEDARVDEANHRLRVAVMNTAPLGALTAVDAAALGPAAVVRVVDFIRWARAMDWVMPADFIGLAAPAPVAAKDLGPRQHTTYLNTIAVLLEMVLSPRPGRDSEAAVIAEMVNNYPDKQGISTRTLAEKFGKAKQSLRAD
ncbi:hypothetical protein [Variovorax terrae]|uniref:Uncharacterized protein n=1 Tax=Variovorax terrae TaxID=2923278 RepID=A0A9X1VVS0_9BURK|nr:hypothetical protein [Variovorax terrae]MCJ0764170.1 hypothetical protein [Variovorax terrae]